MTLAYPRGSIELVPITVLLNGVLISDGVELAVVPVGTPLPITSWAPLDHAGEAVGRLLTGDETPGGYLVYARVTDTPEKPIIRAGSISITPS
ncbi:MAG TPA: hypothetical protein VGC45_15840 [Gryllotalpicola sp.]